MNKEYQGEDLIARLVAIERKLRSAKSTVNKELDEIKKLNLQISLVSAQLSGIYREISEIKTFHLKK